MATKPASTRMEGLVTLFDLHTNFLGKALVGVSDKDMYERLNSPANHMAWLAGSMVAQRFHMASDIGHDVQQTGGELFKDNKGIQAGAEYPTPAAYLADWQKITPLARQALMAIDDQKLDSEIDMGGMKMTWHDLISFTIYREASLVGQLALWRRLLNYPALKYD